MAAIVTPPLDVVLFVGNTSPTKGATLGNLSLEQSGLTIKKSITETFSILSGNSYLHPTPTVTMGRTVTINNDATFLSIGDVEIEAGASIEVLTGGEFIII